MPPPFLYPNGAPEALSYYDVAPLRATLERSGGFRPDQRRRDALQRRRGQCPHRQFRLLRQHHPPDLPGACDGERLAAARLPADRDRGRVLLGWRPRLQYAARNGCSSSRPAGTRSPFRSICGARAANYPRNLVEAETRQKEIRYSSRTRLATNQFKKSRCLRRAAAQLLAKLPKELLQTPEAEMLALEADEKVYNLIQLIYRAKNYEGTSKDYEFSRRTMEEHWRSGYNDAVRTLAPSGGAATPARRWTASSPSISQSTAANRGDPTDEARRGAAQGLRHAAERPGLSAGSLQILQSRVRGHHLPHRSRQAARGGARAAGSGRRHGRLRVHPHAGSRPASATTPRRAR